MDSMELVLTELRALREDVKELRNDLSEYGERTAKLEAQMYPLIGNGSPGRVSKLERAVEKLSQWRWWVLGAAAGASTAISAVAWMILELKR